MNFESNSTHSVSMATIPASVAFRPSWSVEPRSPFLPPWEVCYPLPYLLPGLCWVHALAQEPGALGHPPEG